MTRPASASCKGHLLASVVPQAHALGAKFPEFRSAMTPWEGPAISVKRAKRREIIVEPDGHLLLSEKHLSPVPRCGCREHLALNAMPQREVRVNSQVFEGS